MLVKLLIIGLATWRTSEMVSKERGPFDMFEWLRSSVGVEHQNHDPITWPSNGLSQLVMCQYCNSVWIALAYTVLGKIFPLPVHVLAAASIPALLFEVQQWLGRKH